MRFTIEAKLSQGVPWLRIFDADSGTLRLHWRYRPGQIPTGSDRIVCCDDHACAARSNLHALMRELFLLSCTANASALASPPANDHCIYCYACTPPEPDASLTARLSRTK